jgi:hypothetical protein
MSVDRLDRSTADRSRPKTMAGVGGATQAGHWVNRFRNPVATLEVWLPSLEDRLLAALALVVVSVSAYVAIRFANQPLLEAHGFRQTQTALTSYWMLRQGPDLDYQTPVVGAPWSIPLEFPIYQLLVAGLTEVSGAPLGIVGRVLSWCFLVAGAVPVWAIGRRLELPCSAILTFVCLWLSSPLYMFWGRTFLVETTAVFFVLAALPFAIDLLHGDIRVRTVATVAAFFTLAALQKITTAVPVLIVVGGCAISRWLRREPRPTGTVLPESIALAFGLGIPLVIALAWIKYSDAVKAANAFGAQLMGTALLTWNFGTLSQRLSGQLFLDVLWQRILSSASAGWLGLALVGGALFFSRDARLQGRILICLALLFLPLLIFTNLHIIHDYYQVSCALFVSAALSLAVAIWIPRVVKHALAAPALTALLVASNLVNFSNGYWNAVKAEFPKYQTRTLLIAELLKRHTPADSAFVAFGYDWNSELAYYAERKSFTVPDWFAQVEKAWLAPEAYLGGLELGAIVGCPSGRGPTRDQMLQRLGAEPGWSFVDAQDCQILFRDGSRRLGR